MRAWLPIQRCTAPVPYFLFVPVVLFVLAWLLAAPAWALDVPLLSGRVVDNAQLLSADARSTLAATLKAHEEATGNQIVVLTVPTLEEESVEAYAVRVFETWKLGKKGKDNGLLLLAVPKERKLRIEVGYGLEGVITDAVSSRIIRNVIAPPFKAGHFDQGMKDGVAALIGQLEGKSADALPADAPQPAKSSSSTNRGPSDLSSGERLAIGLFIFGILGVFTLLGVFVPETGWFLYLFLIPFWALFPIAVVGFSGAMTILVIYLIAFPIAKMLIARSEWAKRRQMQPRRGSRFGGASHSSGGWWSSSDSGSSSWGSSSSDSFSGGGGDSGGGGSSGDF